MSAVKRVEAGESPEFVAEGLGINRRTIYRWLNAYHYGGEASLKAKPIPGAPPKLDDKQMNKLSRTIRGKNPQQLKFEYALWTLAIIRQYILDEFKVGLSETSVGRLMKRLGLSAQRPLYRAWQQDPERVKEWQEKTYPGIEKRAKREKALIMFSDEAGLRSDHHSGTTWGAVGDTPIVKSTGARYRVNMLSAVSKRGDFRFMITERSVNAAVFCEFLRRLITGMDRKIFLIVDGHPAHKAKVVQRFLANHQDKIELFFLPAYSPELNPDELVWNHVKSRVGKVVVHTKEQLMQAVERSLHSLQKLPKIVASFFHTSTCMYAA